MAQGKNSTQILDLVDIDLNELQILFDSINRAAVELVESCPAGEVWKLTAIKSMAEDGNHIAARCIAALYDTRKHLENGGSAAEPVRQGEYARKFSSAEACELGVH